MVKRLFSEFRKGRTPQIPNKTALAAHGLIRYDGAKPQIAACRSRQAASGACETAPMNRLRCLVLVILPLCAVFAAAEPPELMPAPRYEYRGDHDPDGIGKFYMGREIAHVMGHQAAAWLDRPEREKEEAPAKLVELLKIKSGDTIADIGAGSGYYTFRLSPLAGPKGRIYAVDVQPEMLALIRQRMKAKGLTNIEPVRGTQTDPKLPANSIDMVLLVDVYHEFTHPWEMTEKMVAALKPGGRLVFVEFRSEDPKVPIKEVHKMSKAQVRKEMQPHPLRWVETIDALPWQHVIVFEKKGEGKR